MPEFITIKDLSNKVQASVGRITTKEVPLQERSNYIWIGESIPTDPKGYSAIIIKSQTPLINQEIPWITIKQTSVTYTDNDVIQIAPSSRRIFSVFKQNSYTNSLYVTDLCNSRCIMCPQPPKETDSVTFLHLKKLIQLLPTSITNLGVTGGEPTLLKEKLADLLHDISVINPECNVHVLSNARLLQDFSLARKIASSGINRLSFGIPLYSADPTIHDYITQVKNSFNETLKGIFNLERLNIPVEIRVVLHKQTIPGLLELVRWIYFNLPFTVHIALMGMEHMGYVKKNWEDLWIDPRNYQEELFEAINFMHLRKMNCSIYNLPLCLIKKELWPFARHSISDYKVDFVGACDACLKRQDCGGLFHYQGHRMNVIPIVSE